MKKTLTLILAIVISLSLCACSNSEVEKSDSLKTDLIGTWERGPYYYSDRHVNWTAKYECEDTIELFEDGTGTHNVDADPLSNLGSYKSQDYVLSWDIKDDKIMIKFEYPGFEFEYSEENGETCLSKPFIFDKENNTLSSTDGKIVFYKLY